MYHVGFVDVKMDDPMFNYCDHACLYANNMRNTSNFHIRNLMTGLKKEPGRRTENEKNVIKMFSDAIPEVNRQLREKYEAKIKKINSDKNLSPEKKKEKISKLKLAQFKMPTAEEWFAGYNLLDAVFRYTKNSDYKAFHSHVMQNAISDTTESWVGFFKSLASYSPGSGHTGKPRIPGYLKSGGRSTAVFSSLACSVKHGLLSFPKMGIPVDSQGDDAAGGNKNRAAEKPKLDVSSIPHAAKDKLIEVRIVPCYGIYRIEIITDDGLREEDIFPGEEHIIGDDGTPAGVMTLDPGLENLAAITDNKGNTPIVIKGGAVISANRFFNKRMTFLKSEQMKGHDPKKYKPEATRQMKALSRKREAFLRDSFYKYAHFIFRLMKERSLSYLIIGHNDGQKQGINMGHVNNQAFVSIPFSKFIGILETVSASYGILVIRQEESYTSKASFGMRDRIPVYGEAGASEAKFSGRRVKRGLYLQDDGKVMNADINGSANIGRKYNEQIFPEGMDTSYLYGTVRAVKHSGIMAASHEWVKKKKSIAGQTA